MGTEATIVLFTAFACLSAELFCALAAAEFGDQPHGRRFVMDAAGAVSLAAAAVSGLINLGRPEMFFAAFGHPGTGIFWELTGALTALFGVIGYAAAQYRQLEGSALKIFACLAAAGSVLILFGVGRNFWMPWRPALDCFLIPVIFVLWAVPGASLLGFEKKPRAAAVSALVLAIVIATYLIRLQCMSDLSYAVDAVLLGSASFYFWSSVVLGAVIPFAASILPQNLFKGWVCAVLSAVGCAAFQWVIYFLGTPAWQFFEQ